VAHHARDPGRVDRPAAHDSGDLLFERTDARALGAEQNISDGKGTIYDQAKFIRNEGRTHGANAALARARSIGARGRKAATIALQATEAADDDKSSDEDELDEEEPMEGDRLTTSEDAQGAEDAGNEEPEEASDGSGTA
jgi:hypothetical protein